MFEIALDWPVASQYLVREIPGSGERGIFGAKGATITLHRPLDENPSVYAELASLNGSEKACLNFAHKYGQLFIQHGVTVYASKGSSLESLQTWRLMIKNLKDIIQRCELSRSNPGEAFRRFGKTDKSLFSIGLSLSIKGRGSPATLEYRAESLISAIQLQAIHSILGGRESHQCIECTRWFEIGIGARRSQSKFCSTRCKDRYHNRLKAQARRSDYA
jgi:hypothetical protein